MDGGNATDDHAVLVVDDLVDALEIKLVDFQLPAAEIDHAGSRADIPLVHFLHAFQGILRPQVRLRTARAPNPQRNQAVHHRSTQPESRQVAVVVNVKVADKDLVEVIVGDFLGGDPLMRPAADIEEELVAVAELDQETGRCLLRPGTRHARAQRRDAHLVGLEVLRAGEVHIPVSQSLGGRYLGHGGGFSHGVENAPVDPCFQCDAKQDTDDHATSNRYFSTCLHAILLCLVIF